MKELDISGRDSEKIDLSKFKQLETLFITEGELTSINLEGLNQLTKLNLQNNRLKTIDISEQKQLVELYLGNNQLKSIDLTGLTKLEKIDLYYNQLSTIDLSDQNALKQLNLESNHLTSLKPFEHLLNNDGFRFLNISRNKIDLQSPENKPIHEQLKKKLSMNYNDEFGAGYQYDSQQSQAFHYMITIGGEKVKVKNGAKTKIPGTKASIMFPHDLPEGTKLDIQPLTKQEKQALQKSLAGTNLEIAGDIFKFTFDNSIPFTGKFALTLSYDKEKYSPKEIAIYHYNEKTKTWEKVGGVVRLQ